MHTQGELQQSHSKLSTRWQKSIKSAFALQQGQFAPKFRVEGVAPPTILLARMMKESFIGYKNFDIRFFRFFHYSRI